MSNKCHECVNFNGVSYCRFRHDGTWGGAQACGAFEKNKTTVFDRITASPEVLAEKLVYCHISGWTSCFINFHTFDRAEAIAATVAKLKEVCDE